MVSVALARLASLSQPLLLSLLPLIASLHVELAESYQPAAAALGAAGGGRQTRGLLLQLLLLLRSGLPQMYICLFYCVIPTARMTLNSAQTAIKHQDLAPRKIKIRRKKQRQEKEITGKHSEGNALPVFLRFPRLFKLCEFTAVLLLVLEDC